MNKSRASIQLICKLDIIGKFAQKLPIVFRSIDRR